MILTPRQLCLPPRSIFCSSYAGRSVQSVFSSSEAVAAPKDFLARDSCCIAADARESFGNVRDALGTIKEGEDVTLAMRQKTGAGR
jgi:hypothetical protein